MGKLRENMEKLVNQIRSSAGARHRAVAEMCRVTGDLLAQHQRELAQNARALSTRLAEERKEQLRAARELKTGRERVRASRRAAVGAVMRTIAADVGAAGRVWRTTRPAHGY